MVEHLTDDDYQAIMAEIEGQNDRGVAITGCAFVEEHLAWAIRTRFIDLSSSKQKLLFGGSGPFSTFLNRIEVAFALGLCTENIVRDLKKIGEIRNQFAHSMKPIHFIDGKIKGKCSELLLAKARKLELSDYSDPKTQYVFTCKTLMALIVAEAIEKEKSKPTPPNLLSG